MPVFNVKPTWSNFKVSNEGLILSLRKVSVVVHIHTAET